MNERIRGILALGDVWFCVALGVWVAWQCRTHWNLRCWIGAVVAVAGLALWITARRQLGASFSLAAKAKALVNTGLYSKFRHPVYYFGFVAYCGIALIWGHWIALVCFVVLYAILELPRMVKEERVLTETFGDAYREYRAQTWF